MKIYDCFQFFNELDILEIRLELLYDHVDYFVISETNKTHSNNDKPFYFEDNKHLFDKYMDKIIHIKTDYPINILKFEKRDELDKYNIQYNKISDIYDKEENEGDLKKWPTFCRDFLQREFIKFGLMECEDNDLIMVGDLDEIPNPIHVDNIKNNNLVDHCILQNCYYYHINTMLHTNWYGNYIVKYEKTKDVSLTHLRNQRSQYTHIENGGWHISFMGGEGRIKNKLESYAHQEYNNDNIKNQIENRIKYGVDIFGRSDHTYNKGIQQYYFNGMVTTDLSEYPPEMINNIKTKFNYLIK